MHKLNISGVEVFKSHLAEEEQKLLLQDTRSVVLAAPLYRPQTPQGKPMSVRMTSAGDFGWFSDRNGYRYEQRHPNGSIWPDIPNSILNVWRDVSGSKRMPECCLLNYYYGNAKMGLHQDVDEADFDQPVVSISLGDSALFRVGGLERNCPTESIWLESGDVCVMGGESRRVYHGIDRIRFGSSSLLKNGGRLSLTLRVVT